MTYKLYVFLILLLSLFWFSDGMAATPNITLKYQHIYVELGIGQNGYGIDNWKDGGGTGALIEAGVKYTITNSNIYINAKYLHLSQYEIGPPFNSDPEDSVNSLMLVIGYIWDG